VFIFAKPLSCLVIVAVVAACSSGVNRSSNVPTASQSPSPSTTLPTGRVTFYGADPGDQAGAIISGDFNGDEAIDIAVSADTADGPSNDRADAGEVYVFFGPFQPGSSLDAGAGQYDEILYGAAPGDNFGRALAAGDFNKDGVDDLAIGAPAAGAQAGAVYVMLGGQWAREIDFHSADPDVLFTGGDPGDYAGFMLSSGDIEGDGGAELVIGAMLADGPQNRRTDAGEIYLLDNARSLAGNHIELSQTPNVIYGADAGDRLGEALTTGDLNGDGKTDLVLVATFGAGPANSRPGAGETYVLESPLTFPIDLASATLALEVIGADPGDQLGHSIGVGDTDGDGMGDIWLGAVSADGPGNEVDLAGEAVLVPGGAGRSGVTDAGAGQASATIYGPEKEARLGRCLAVGDVNGDGKADLLIAAPNMAARAGRLFVFYGPGPYPQGASGANLTLGGLDAGDILGHESFGTPCISTADVDGDGRRDVLVSAAQGDGPDNTRTDAGEAYLIPSSALVP
jgi:hypothetical protein